MRTDSPRLLFLVRSLNYGGAERQLVALAAGLRRQGESVAVAVFYSGGPLHRDLQAAGVRVFSLEKRARWDVFGFFARLIGLVRRLRPAILHSYLGPSNILSVLLKALFPTIRIVWGVRASNMDLNRYGWLDRLLYRVECVLSRFADLIIVNSYSGLDYAIAQGFPRQTMIVIPNGIDMDQFRPDPESGKRFRKDWGIEEKEHLVGLVARLDPMKDYSTFLKAAALLAHDRHDVRFMCIGEGPEPYEKSLREMCNMLRLEDRVIWVGAYGYIAAAYNAMDIMTSSSSYGEGFSNVIGEAMACGVPCVVTDVGDSKRIVGEMGYVVSPRDSAELCAAWRKMLEEDPAIKMQRSRQTRARIIQHFSLERLVDDTRTTLGSIV